MHRSLTLAAILIIVITASGCSVFGVATRNDLDTALLQEATARQRTEVRLESLDLRLADLAADLADLDRRLRPRLASLDSALIRTSAEVAMVTERWSDLRDDLTADLDSLYAGYDVVLDEVAAVRGNLLAAQGELLDVGVRADVARDRSRQAVQLHRDALQWERERLQRRLVDLERRLQGLDAAVDSTEAEIRRPVAPAPFPEGSGAGGRVEISSASPRR